jgi:hypothetical protein
MVIKLEVEGVGCLFVRTGKQRDPGMNPESTIYFVVRND